MEISRRVAEQLKQLMRRVTFLESRLQAIPNNTSVGDLHYLVEAPVDGIPAFADNMPGMASCAIVRRYSNNTAEDKELAISTTKQRVFNLGAEITDGQIVVAHRDAYGDFFIPAFTVVCLAQAPSGGIPARTGITPGSATCTQVIIASLAGSGFSAGDLVKTSHTFTALNWDMIAHGEDGDRIIQVSSHSDNALLIGSSCTNEEDPAGILLYEPT